MALISPLRRLLGRRPVEIDLSGTQAARLSSPDARNSTAAPPALLENESRDIVAAREAQREVTQLLRRLVERLEAQASTPPPSDPSLQQLPKAIDALGDLRRQGLALMDALNEQLEAGRQRDEAMRAAFHRVSESSEQGAELMRHVQEHLEAATQTAGGLSESVHSLRTTLGELSAGNERVARSLEQVAGVDQERHERIVRTLSSWQRWSVAAAACAAVAALMAAGAAIAVLVTVLF